MPPVLLDVCFTDVIVMLHAAGVVVLLDDACLFVVICTAGVLLPMSCAVLVQVTVERGVGQGF